MCTRYVLDRNEGLTWLLFQVPSGWGHPFKVEFCGTLSRLEEVLGLSLWQHIAVPPPLFNVGMRVLYINHSGNVY